jgi:hypothetical protein
MDCEVMHTLLIIVDVLSDPTTMELLAGPKYTLNIWAAYFAVMNCMIWQ